MMQGEGETCRRRSRRVSRRSLISGGVGAAILASGLAANGARAASKVAKTQAGYKDSPRGAVRCDRCRLFQPPSGCQIVDGAISPGGSCDFFAPKPR